MRSGGAFDAATVSVVELLRDGGPGAARTIVARVRAMDRSLWAVDPARGVAMSLTDVPILLDAIAKAYVVDRAAARGAAARRAATAGVLNVLLPGRGDLRHGGNRTRGAFVLLLARLPA